MIPTTYAQWSDLLSRFGEGNDDCLDEMVKGSFEVDAGTVSRFYALVEQVYSARKQLWLDKFSRGFQMNNYRSEEDFGIAIRNAKQNLNPLVRFVTIKGYPEDLSKLLIKDLEEFVTEIRDNLKKNVKSMSSGRDKMLIVVNSFVVNLSKNQESAEADMRSNAHNPNSTSETGRRIIF